MIVENSSSKRSSILKQDLKAPLQHESLAVLEMRTQEDELDEVFEQVGGFGWFQVFAYVAIGFGMSATAWFVQESGYLTQEPDGYICYDSQGQQLPEDVCTKDNICADDSPIASWEIDTSSGDTLYNFQQRLDLTCVDSWKVSAIGSSFFLGWASTLLWLPRFADRGGRKKIFWLIMFIDLLLYTAMLLVKNLAAMISIWFLFGCMQSVSAQVGYVYLTEMMPKRA